MPIGFVLNALLPNFETWNHHCIDTYLRTIFFGYIPRIIPHTLMLHSTNGTKPLPPSKRRFIAVVLGCTLVGLFSLWVHNFEEEDPVSSVHSLARVNHDFPIDFVWSGWDGVSEDAWEYDYFRELFPPPLFVHVNSSMAPGIMKCSEENHVNDILHHARNGHVKIVVQSSDEYGGQSDSCNACFKTFKGGKSNHLHVVFTITYSPYRQLSTSSTL